MVKIDNQELSIILGYIEGDLSSFSYAGSGRWVQECESEC